MEKTMVLPENVELTEEIKTLYKTKDGRYFLSKEGAQEKLATHFPCKCGNGIREKYRIHCDNCEPKKVIPFKEWDGKTPLYCNNYDRYFFELDDLISAIEDEDLDKESIDLRICEPSYFREVDSDYWEDVMPENMEELPKVIKEKLAELNETIKNYKEPASWSPTKYRTTVDFNQLSK